MSTFRLALCAAIPVLLSTGCSKGTEVEQNAAAPAAQPAAQDDYATRLRAMPEGARNAVFIRAIRDAGFDCQHVASSSEIGKAGAAAWSAVCSDSGPWIVAIGTNGNAQVARGAPLPPEEQPAAANSQGR